MTLKGHRQSTDVSDNQVQQSNAGLVEKTNQHIGKGKEQNSMRR